MSKRVEVRCPNCNNFLFEAQECKDAIVFCSQCNKSIRVTIDDIGQMTINSRVITDKYSKYNVRGQKGAEKALKQ